MEGAMSTVSHAAEKAGRTETKIWPPGSMEVTGAVTKFLNWVTLHRLNHLSEDHFLTGNATEQAGPLGCYDQTREQA